MVEECRKVLQAVIAEQARWSMVVELDEESKCEMDTKAGAGADYAIRVCRLNKIAWQT